MGSPTTHLLYLHGFRSSPASFKARRMGAVMAERFPSVTWWCPQLPASPAAAAELIATGTKDWPTDRMAVIGSSLGGFYATWFAETRGCHAVVLNPAVHPARDLAKYIGEQTSWHDPKQRFFFRAEFVGELRGLEQGKLQDPARYMAVIAKGDEVLDWREMAGRYAGSRLKLLEGGDHALSDFELHLPNLLAFLQLA